MNKILETILKNFIENQLKNLDGELEVNVNVKVNLNKKKKESEFDFDIKKNR